jgi:3'-5' exonuclease
MLDKLNKETILFLDIETVPQHETYGELPESHKKLWDKKVEALQRSNKTNLTPDEYYRSAGIYAEFGKIICIGAGYISKKQFRVKLFSGNDEKKLLADFAALLNKHFNKAESLLCAHNGKEFDFPLLVCGVALPKILNSAGKKPWEVKHLDTMELWKFGDNKSFTSLNLLAHVLGVPTPKDDIDGSMVYDVYWKEKNLKRIADYCAKDVLTVAQILLRMRGEALISAVDVVMA